jgi:hypothetical protein
VQYILEQSIIDSPLLHHADVLSIWKMKHFAIFCCARGKMRIRMAIMEVRRVTIHCVYTHRDRRE